MHQTQYSTAFTLAKTIVQQTNKNLFLTGKAGTGKTTFLKYIKANTLKQLAVVAPTGVAAINAGGVTIHSFFSLPFTPYLSNAPYELIGVAGALDKNQLLARTKISGQKKDIFQQLELLIIDEVSMVRADVLDAIDTLLKHYRNNPNYAFGGVQVLCIGDMMQLPPVAKQDEWAVMQNIYRSVYFFDSHVFAKANMACVELDTIYRQTEQTFISLLNNIRNSSVQENDVEILKQLYHPYFNSIENKGYITLTSHNAKAENINDEQLQNLNEPIYSFKATVEGDFDEKIYPTYYTLQFKVGAQIMFIKNDLEKEKRFYNGKIATITFLTNDSITVTTAEQNEIEVPIHTWENIIYNYNQSTQKIEEQVIGSFKQYPIKLAWAITIHKSQGLTFDKVAIDAFKAFAPGQVYVALSRCTSLQGIKLLSPIQPNNLVIDEHINAFNNYTKSIQQSINIEDAVKQSIIETLIQLYNFEDLQKLQNQLLLFSEKHSKLLTVETNSTFKNQHSQLKQMQEVAQKFHLQLKQLLFTHSINNEIVQERLHKAAQYFGEQLNVINEQTKNIVVNHKTKIIKDEFIPKYDKWQKELAFKMYLVNNCANEFVLEDFLKAKFNYKPSLQSKLNMLNEEEELTEVAENEGDLLNHLTKIVNYLAEKEGIKPYLIIHKKTLKLMANLLPQTSEELLQIEGMGEIKVSKYGNEFLTPIKAYSTKNNLTSLVNTIVPKQKNAIGESAKLSLSLFKEHLSIAKVAQERNLSPVTISGHLALFVANGDIDISHFVTATKLEIILETINNKLPAEAINKLSTLKEILGEAYSYDEIKMAFSYHKLLINQSQEKTKESTE